MLLSVPYLFIIGFISLDLTSLTTSLSLNDDCLTPNNESALCISIYDCESFLRNISNRTADIKNFMKRSECGKSDYSNDVLVCCGSVASFTQVVTPKPIMHQRKISELEFLPSQEQCAKSKLAARIYGGNETRLDEYPWMALLKYERSKRFRCGGFLISDRYVLTAAHCVVGTIRYERGKLISVRLGEHDLRTEIDERIGIGKNQPYQDIPVENILWHNKYLSNRNYATNKLNDIAVVKLSRNVVFSDFIRPICLPLTVKRTNNNLLFVAGWGFTENRNKPSKVKRAVYLNLFDHEECKAIYKKKKKKITNNQICAGGEEGKDSCVGDSGGPLMKVYIVNHREQLFAEGIVSFGSEICGTIGIPGVYVNITTYLDWINDSIKALEQQ